MNMKYFFPSTIFSSFETIGYYILCESSDNRQKQYSLERKVLLLCLTQQDLHTFTQKKVMLK